MKVLALCTALLLVIVPSQTVADANDDIASQCGLSLSSYPARPLPSGVQRIKSIPGKRTFDIVANVGPGLQANPAALAAWNAAVAEWESILQDPVTVVIDVDLGSSPSLASTAFSLFFDDYDSIRNAMVADAGPNEAIVQLLPTLAQFSAMTPPGFVFQNGMAASKANLRALGFDMSFDDPNPDATITFQSGAAFDFDRSDGIEPSQYDFQGAAFHELAHALGFFSEVDNVDIVRNFNQTKVVEPLPLDLFRFVPGAGSVDFTNEPRVLATGDLAPVQVLFDGTQDLAMSTGIFFGDFRQAGHWKADEYSGTYLGVMDPTMNRGELRLSTANDLRAMGLMGWDVVSAPVAAESAPELTYRISAFPNPFNPRTTLRLEMADEGRAQVTIYDAVGRHVATVLDGWMTSGTHEVFWSGHRQDGALVPSGVYHAKLAANGNVNRVKITLLK